ncbi:E3 ubiquitin-protein ligase MBR2-like [Rutidosis leptorrhynchoides]|uniref:E3 ubiquitin-protein ligase MBR2-like n=1 Tax=Rutidosis leptorrhynchoides TaxID=125765 RepID=UPI003A9A0511
MPGRPSMNVVIDENVPFSIWAIRNYGHLISDDRRRYLFYALMAAHENGRFSPETVVSAQPPLSKEQISEHLRVMKRNVDGGCEGEQVDSCSICLGDYKENEMIGVLECGHQFHAECIKGWLLCNNVCPLCRATALTV